MGIKKNCVYNFSQLQVLNAEEDDFFSDGDEPYFVYISFKSRTATKGSTQTFINAFDNDEWAEGIKQEQSKNIPAFMGRIVIPVSLLDFADVVEANKNKTPLTAEIVGVIGIALESDATPFKLVRKLMSNLRAEIQSNVASIIENLPSDLSKIKFDKIAPDIASSVEKLKSKFTPSFAQKFLIFLQSAGDPDDFAGFSAQYNVCVDKDLLLILNAFSGKNLQVPNILVPQNFSLDYKGKGVHYRVNGNISLE